MMSGLNRFTRWLVGLLIQESPHPQKAPLEWDFDLRFRASSGGPKKGPPHCP